MIAFQQAFLIGHVFFQTALPCSGGYHLERGGIPLHNAVGETVKKEQLLKIKVQVSSIWARGCMLNDCVCVCYLI